ncbi:MAG: PAS domain-containing protein, partial [bacterium]
MEVFTAAAFGAVLSSSIMQWDLRFELQQTVDFHALVLLVVLNGMLIGTIVSEKKLLQGTDSFREGVLESVSFAAQRLAGVENWETYFADVLRQFGEASRCSYVCLFEAWPLEHEHTFELLPYDWSSPKYKLGQEQLALLNRMRSREITRNIHRLGNGEVWRDPPASSTHEEKAVWTASGIRFTLVMPVRVDRELWGCVVLGRAENQEDWTRREMGTVCNAMRTLGSLFASARTTEQIQQLSENIRGDLWISSPDGHSRIGLSPRGDTLDGRNIARLPDSWMDAIHGDDISAVEEALSGRGDFDMEYRIILADRSVRWVRDRGFVVRNEMGQVSRVIGMAEDVTAQKNVEAELEQSVDLLAALFDKMGSGILV